MNFPDYTLTYRYPVYSYNPLDLSMLESVFSVKEDSRDCPLLNEVLGGTFTETRLDSPNGTYQFHWIVANQFANEVDLIRFDPYWNDAPVVIARYPVKTITTYATAAQGPESSVVGKWIVNYDWNCTGSPRNDQMIINSDGTWAWGTGGTGKWTRTGDNIHIVSDGGPAVYDGTIQASTISGAISRIGVTEGPRTGCWSASKVSS
jgi:hypothetical protein